MNNYLISQAHRDEDGELVEFRIQEVDGQNTPIGNAEFVSFHDLISLLDDGAAVYPLFQGAAGGKLYPSVDEDGNVLLEQEDNGLPHRSLKDLPRY
jgi:hypothetical protein